MIESLTLLIIKFNLILLKLIKYHYIWLKLRGFKMIKMENRVKGLIILCASLILAISILGYKYDQNKKYQYELKKKFAQQYNDIVMIKYRLENIKQRHDSLIKSCSCYRTNWGIKNK